MQRGILVLLLTVASGAINSPARAEWRCDCTTILDSCTAEVVVQDTFIDVTAPAAQCARVDYFIDGMPFVSVAVDGAARENWIARSEDPRVLVQSCQVCRDNAETQTAAVAGTDYGNSNSGTAPAELSPLVAPQPTYPRQAQVRGLEGNVRVEFIVNPFGDTQDVRVVSAQPAGVFDLAAISAVSRWRYPADGEREPVSQSETLEFRIDDFIFADNATAETPAVPGQTTARQFNQCVRENISYNYGEMIEVGLINACAQPMIVFTCATGVGPVAERWICSSTEDNGTVLVRPGDSRLGFPAATPTATGIGTYDYTENFFVARAPNSEYWWIACSGDDVSCRAGARQWAASLDRQAAHINPQTRTRLALARSF